MSVTGSDAVADVQTYLAAQSLVDGGTGVTSRRHRMTDTPDHQLVITADGGGTPEIWAASGIGDQARQTDGVQIMCRSDPGDGDQAYDVMADVYEALHGLLDTTLGSTTYIGVRARTGGPIPLGFDDKGRALFSCSYLLHRLV